MNNKKINNIAFIVPEFPVLSQTWLLTQVTNLIDQGINVDVFTIKLGDPTNVSEEYVNYKLLDRTTMIGFPNNLLKRYSIGFGMWLRLLLARPLVALRVMDVFRYGNEALSLKLLFRVWPFVGSESKYDLIHCHFGTVANKFLPVKEVLKLKQPLLVTLYGYDVSHIPKQKGVNVYRPVIENFDRFLVMSKNMRERILSLGFPKEKIIVHPISIDVESYPFKERPLKKGEEIKLAAVGRFVEKKGFDDLIKAIGIVKKKTKDPFHLDLVGDGELRPELEKLATEEGVTDVIDFRGYMKLEDIKDVYDQTHIYIQPSKTAKDGDME